MTQQTAIKTNQLEDFINKGARKSDLYRYYKPHSDKVIRNEILDLLIEERGISKKQARLVRTLKGSEVEILENRLG